MVRKSNRILKIPLSENLTSKVQMNALVFCRTFRNRHRIQLDLISKTSVHQNLGRNESTRFVPDIGDDGLFNFKLCTGQTLSISRCSIVGQTYIIIYVCQCRSIASYILFNFAQAIFSGVVRAQCVNKPLFMLKYRTGPDQRNNLELNQCSW